MEGYVYILKSTKNNTYYIGSSKDPIKRLREHNKGGVAYTRNLVPWKLVFSQRYEDIKMARKIEMKLKRLKRRDIIERIVREGVIKKKV